MVCFYMELSVGKTQGVIDSWEHTGCSGEFAGACPSETACFRNIVSQRGVPVVMLRETSESRQRRRSRQKKKRGLASPLQE